MRSWMRQQRSFAQICWTTAKRCVTTRNVSRNNRRISAEQAERYAAQGAYQIGIKDSIYEIVDEATEIVRADLLDDGEKVRHNSERLAQVVLGCRKQALAAVAV